jgi:hypothetical protein
MSKVIIIAAIGLSVCAAVVLTLIRFSPEGHEDRRGFHFGPKKKSADRSVREKSKVA